MPRGHMRHGSSGMVPPARRAARPPSRGHSRKRRSGAPATILRATRIGAASRHHTARARAVSDLAQRPTAIDLQQCLRRAGRGTGGPAASRGREGLRLAPCAVMMDGWRRHTPRRTEALGPDPARVSGRLRALVRRSLEVTWLGAATTIARTTRHSRSTSCPEAILPRRYPHRAPANAYRTPRR